MAVRRTRTVEISGTRCRQLVRERRRRRIAEERGEPKDLPDRVIMATNRAGGRRAGATLGLLGRDLEFRINPLLSFLVM